MIFVCIVTDVADDHKIIYLILKGQPQYIILMTTYSTEPHRLAKCWEKWRFPFIGAKFTTF